MPELNFNVLARQGPKGVLQGFEQGQEFRNQMLRQEQQREAGDLAIKLDKAKFDEYENDRKELAQLKEQLKGQGLTPESYAEVLTSSGIPQYVEMGMKAKQKLQEIAQYNKIMGYSDDAAPAASQAGAVPSVVRLPQQAPAAPVNALGSGMYGMEQPVAPAAPVNAMVAPRVPAAPMGNVVAAQFGPEQIASISDRIEKLTALGTPQALQTAGMLQRQLEMMSKQKSPTEARILPPGAIMVDATGRQIAINPRSAAAAGGTAAKAAPTESEVRISPKEVEKREAAYPKATLAVKSFDSEADSFIKDLEKLRDHPGLSSITGVVAGRTPSFTKEGRAAQALYDKIVAKGGFQALQNIRNSSPTGGALGSISNQEGAQLKQSIAALDQRQDASDVQNALNGLIEDVRGSKQRVRDAYDMTYEYKSRGGGKVAPAPAAPGVPKAGTVQDGYRFKGGNPADPKSWEKL